MSSFNRVLKNSSFCINSTENLIFLPFSFRRLNGYLKIVSISLEDNFKVFLIWINSRNKILDALLTISSCKLNKFSSSLLLSFKLLELEFVATLLSTELLKCIC